MNSIRIDCEIVRKMRERAFATETAAILALLCAVAMMLPCLAAVYLDAIRLAWGFAGAATAFFAGSIWWARRATQLHTAAARCDEVNRRHELRTAALS